MSSRLGTLTLDLIAKTGNFVGPIEKSTKKTRDQFKKLNDDAKKLGIAFGAAISGYVAAIGTLTTKGLIAVDAQAKLSRSLDTTFDSITALNMAFGDGGIDGFESSLNRLNRRLGAAELGRGAALQTVKDLNLNLTELSNLNADERVAAIADRIKAVARNSQEAARFAQDLGFEQAASAQFFLQGGDAIRQYSKDVEALGLSVSDFDATQIEAANDALGIFGDITQGVQQQLAVAAAPFLEVIGTEIENAIKAAGGLDDVAGQVFVNIVKGAGFAADAFSGIGRVVDIAANAIIVTFAGALDVLAGGAAKTLEILNAIPTIRLLIDEQDIQQLRDFQSLQQQVAREGLSVIQNELEQPLPSDAIEGWLSEARAKTEEARAAFEASQSSENEFRNESIRLTKDQVSAQEEYLKKLQETQQVLNASQLQGLDAQFEQYLNLAKQDLASGSQFINDRINTLRDITQAQRNSGFNVDSIAVRENILATLEAGQLPTATGQVGEDMFANLAKEGVDLARLAYEEAKRISENTLRTADTLIAQMEQKQADPIGTILLQIPGTGGQSPFEARLQGAESELQRLNNFVNNFTNDAARVAAGG